MDKNTERNIKKPLSRSQVNQNYIAKLKANNKFDDHKKKVAAAVKKNRAEMKKKENKMTENDRARAIKKRRDAVRERVTKCRERKKHAQPQSNDSVGAIKKSYRNKQTLFKATKKVTIALPKSPTKKKAVLANILKDCNENDRNELMNVLESPQIAKQKVRNIEILTSIRKFFQRDDISRTSPKVKDVRQYICPVNGEAVFLPKRHMILTIKESYAVFIEERKDDEKELCSISFFDNNRPENVKLIKDLPNDMCMCQYHSNFILAVKALHNIVPDLPKYKDGFVQKFLCKNATKECWFGNCVNCTGITIHQLKDGIGNVSLNSAVKWTVWKKNLLNKRIEKQEQSTKLRDLIVHIESLSPKFLRHSYIKTAQSNTFNSFDIPRALNSQYSHEGTLQVDFAENFVCEAQDEVQSAHWNQRQLSLFTAAIHFNDLFQSKVFVSDSLVHTKETIIPYVYKLLTELPKSLKILKIWSDGPSSQFKNKYIAAMIPQLETEFHLKIYWNYFATSHGKGCVDGIGATTKIIVRKHVRARESIVNCAADFVKTFHRTQSKISVEEATEVEFQGINKSLNTSTVFGSAKNIRDIASAHQIQVRDGKIVSFHISKEGYD